MYAPDAVDAHFMLATKRLGEVYATSSSLVAPWMDSPGFQPGAVKTRVMGDSRHRSGGEGWATWIGS